LWTLLFLIITAEVFWLMVIPLAWAFGVLYAWLEKGRDLTVVYATRRRQLIGLAVQVVMLGLVAAPQPWLPGELLKTQDGVERLVYVLKDDGELVVLESDPRRISRLPAGSITSRRICDEGAWHSKRIFQIVRPARDPAYPECPKRSGQLFGAPFH
jgi:hypothetical protein